MISIGLVGVFVIFSLLLEVGIDGDQFFLQIMTFELKMHQRGYDIQGGSEGSFYDAIVDAPIGNHKELQTYIPNIFFFGY